KKVRLRKHFTELLITVRYKRKLQRKCIFIRIFIECGQKKIVFKLLKYECSIQFLCKPCCQCSFTGTDIPLNHYIIPLHSSKIVTPEESGLSLYNSRIVF